MKYRRMWPVYIADMYDLQHRSPEVWAAHKRGDFSCQKSDIPGTAIGQDHAGEQENKIIESCGGITGITRNKNSRARHFLAAPILSFISKEMMEIGETNISQTLVQYTTGRINKGTQELQYFRVEESRLLVPLT